MSKHDGDDRRYSRMTVDVGMSKIRQRIGYMTELPKVSNA
jgi:hypothetical protein